MFARIEEDGSLPKRILFSDECTFFLHGKVNSHNFRYWYRVNPFLIRETKTQYPKKVKVSAGILKDKIIRLVFIDGNLTGQLYLEILQESLVPLI